MAHFEWLGLATSESHAMNVWARVLLGVMLSWVVVLGVLGMLQLIR